MAKFVGVACLLLLFCLMRLEVLASKQPDENGSTLTNFKQQESDQQTQCDAPVKKLDEDGDPDKTFLERLGSVGVTVYRNDDLKRSLFIDKHADDNENTCRLVRGRRIVATYGSHGDYIAQTVKSCNKAIQTPGIDLCLAFGPDFMDETFRQQNAHILRTYRGAGLWLWKPYLILRLLLEMNDDDVLFYMDSDKILVSNLEDHICLQAKVKQDVVVFFQGFVEHTWTKADAYMLMNVENEPRIKDSAQIYGSYLLLKKSVNSIRFVTEWLTYCQDERIIGESKSEIRAEHEKFRDNRHDQTVLSLLSKKWNLPSWPSGYYDWGFPQYGVDNNGFYFTAFNELKTQHDTPKAPIIDDNLP